MTLAARLRAINEWRSRATAPATLTTALLTDRTVDQFARDVGVPCVTGGLLEQMQCHPSDAVARLALARRVESGMPDDLVRLRALLAVLRDRLVDGRSRNELVELGLAVAIRFVAEDHAFRPAVLDPRQMDDQS